MSEPPKALLIGDIASLIGTSASTLRLWEERGIVEPEKDDRNRYRRYTPDDSCRFLFARKYRSFGVPLSQVGELMSAGEEERGAALRERRDALDEEIRRLIAARASLDKYLEDCGGSRELIGRFVLGERPATLFFPCVERGAVRPGRRSLIREILNRLPAVDYVVELEPNRGENGTSLRCRWGYGIGEETAESLPPDLRSKAVLLPRRSCVLTTVERKSARDFTEAEFRSLLDGMRSCGVELDGPVIGHILEIETGERLPRYKVLLFLPIKE